MQITKADIGKTFQTKGGWTATVVWVTRAGLVWAIHEHEVEDVRKHHPDGRHYFGEKLYHLLPPVETLRGIVSFPGASGAPIAKVDVDLLDGKIVAVRLVEHG